MFPLEPAFAVVIAVVLTMAATAALLILGIRFSVICLFLVIFMTTLAGGKLIPPVGPLILDVPWLSMFLAGVSGSTAVTVLALLPYLVQPRRERNVIMQPKAVPLNLIKREALAKHHEDAGIQSARKRGNEAYPPVR